MSKVLQLYRQLHRTTRYVFKGDIASINTVSAKIREEFDKNRSVKSDTAVEELIKYGQEADEILRKFVLQIEQVDDTTYRQIFFSEALFSGKIVECFLQSLMTPLDMTNSIVLCSFVFL